METRKIFDGKYEVTSDGRIFSFAYGRKKELKGKITKQGYRAESIWVNAKHIHPVLHRLIATAFIPNPDNLPQINHKDGNKLNNNVENLEWVTASQNTVHARDHGLLSITKITMEIANEIREMYKTGKYKQVEIAKMFNIDKSNISNIVLNKQWKIEE